MLSFPAIRRWAVSTRDPEVTQFVLDDAAPIHPARVTSTARRVSGPVQPAEDSVSRTTQAADCHLDLHETRDNLHPMTTYLGAATSTRTESVSGTIVTEAR